MHFPQLAIRKKDDPKGRAFTVHFVASIEAPRLVAPASNGTVRPVLLAYAGSPSAVRAFTANLRCGHPAEAEGHRRYELLRSAGYRYQATAPAPGKALVLAYLPDLFHLQPGVQNHDALRFVSAPPRWWLDEQEALLAPELGPGARDYARAMAFVARLDARTPLPIANDPAFHHALYGKAIEEPWTATEEDRTVLDCRGLEALGLEAPVLCDVRQRDFAGFLAEATAELLPRHRQVAVARPRPAIAAPRPVVPFPPRSTQLTLDFLTA